jgi:hypothetical protein
VTPPIWQLALHHVKLVAVPHIRPRREIGGRRIFQVRRGGDDPRTLRRQLPRHDRWSARHRAPARGHRGHVLNSTLL